MMEEIGHYRIRGKAKSQRNWMIYADVKDNKGVLHIQDYKNNGLLLFGLDGKFSSTHYMHGFVIFKDLSLDEFNQVLESAETFYMRRYKSLKWFLDNNKIDKIKVVLRLIK